MSEITNYKHPNCSWVDSKAPGAAAGRTRSFSMVIKIMVENGRGKRGGGDRAVTLVAVTWWRWRQPATGRTSYLEEPLQPGPSG